MTLEELNTRLAAYLAAETKILQAQEYTIGQGATARRLTRADLGEIRAEIKSLRVEIEAKAPASRRRVLYARPFR